jgi:hypothetical protein
MMNVAVVNSTSPAGTIQEYAQLFNTIIRSWQTHPNHFGYPLFDDFMKSLPNIYYAVLQYQQQYQQQLALYQQGQSTPPSSVESDSQLEIESNSSVSSAASASASPQPQEPEQLDDAEQQQQPQPTQQAEKAEHNPCERQVVDDDEAESKENPFSMLPLKVKMGKYRKPRPSAAVSSRLQVIEEDKCTSSPSASPLPPIPSPNLSPCPLAAKLNAFAAEFRPCASDKKYKLLREFVPKHAARAKLNIYIPKHMTKTLLAAISEPFPNTNTLYYYLDISTALQINDHQTQIMETSEGKKIVLINYDLHQKESEQPLYAVVTANDEHKVEVNTAKWLWKIEEFLTEREIVDKYEIDSDDIPKSSRLMTQGLYDQLKTQLANLRGIDNLQLLTEFKWNLNELKQIGSSQKAKKGKKLAEVKASLSVQEWVTACCNSWRYLPAIPIIVYENRDLNKHWIEWVKMIYVQSQQCFVGLSFRYSDECNSWRVESICLDKSDIQNKHRLLNLQANADQFEFNTSFDEHFEKFNTRLTEIQWE